MQVNCSCAAGKTGVQVCQKDNTYGVCSCEPGADGGTGTGGNTADGGLGGNTGTGGTGLIGGGGQGGLTTTTDAGSDAPLPPPMPGAGSTLLIPGTALLIGAGPNSCTNQTPASGDRWCGIEMPSVFAGQVDLWVFNATQAAAGTAISCNGADPNCVRLSTNLFLDQSGQGTGASSFDGDTLIYSGDTGPAFMPPSATDPTGTPGTGFIGTIYAWRPGWTGGRALTSNAGVFCRGHLSTDVALCFENPDATTNTSQLTYDLHGGKLPATDGAPTLDKVETIIVQTATDPANVVKFQADLSPAGDYVLYSARPTATGVETLKTKKIGDASAPVMVAADVSQWLVSSDSAKWYWLKTFNYSTSGAPSGTLQSAPFPGGASPATLAPNVGVFNTAGAKGLFFEDVVTGGQGNLKLMADTGTPATVKTIDTRVMGIFSMSADGSTVAYNKAFDSTTGLVNLVVGGATLATPCIASSTAVSPQFAGLLASGGGMMWARFNAANNQFDGMFANIGTCTSTKIGSNVLEWLTFADQGFLYMDDGVQEADTITRGTIRFSQVAGGALPMGTSVQTRADPVFAPLVPALKAVVYAVFGTGQGDGIYINTALPFTAR
jgi:hypothetical protein